MGSISTVAEPLIDEEPQKHSKKRKRNAAVSDELEVDVNAPEPPSKKALRKAKKGKSPVAATSTTSTAPITNPTGDNEEAAPALKAKDSPAEQATTSKRSEHGIWIGNLAYTVTKADLRNFFTNNTDISESIITRIHIPPPTAAASSQQRIKPQNKGFAYVDFSNQDAVTKALTLSETLLTGRKVLIKDAHNFEGRPEKEDDGAKDSYSKFSGKSPSKRIFVGNLTFDTEKVDLEEHFAQCGEVVAVHVATFEDSGKCKGYAWVTFAETEAAEAAVRGYVMKKAVDEDEEENDKDEEGEEKVAVSRKKKKPKDWKWWVNKLKGRQLRMEFAEDATVRYKKRFGKDAPPRSNGQEAAVGEEEGGSPTKAPTLDRGEPKPSPKRKADRPPRPPRKVDARNIRPGAAHAAAPRLTVGIVASQGKKVTFD
ncbi:MAG: hypothetical protein Q9166_004911 [cf. Caloplaca sp. 2 TL-2023]